MMRCEMRTTWLLLAAALLPFAVGAQGLRERLQQAREASLRPATQLPALPAGARVLRDVA